MKTLPFESAEGGLQGTSIAETPTPHFSSTNPDIYTGMTFALVQDVEGSQGKGAGTEDRNPKTLQKQFEISLPRSAREGEEKKFPAPECYESGEVETA